MDGAETYRRSFATVVNVRLQCVGGRGACGEALGVSLSEACSSADLGGSSNYSSEILED